MRDYNPDTVELVRIKPNTKGIGGRRGYLLCSFDATGFDNEVSLEEQTGEPILAYVEIPGFDEFVMVKAPNNEDSGYDWEFVLIPKAITDIVKEEMSLENEVSKSTYNPVRGSAKPIVTNRLSEFFGVLQDFVKSWRQS